MEFPITKNSEFNNTLLPYQTVQVSVKSRVSLSFCQANFKIRFAAYLIGLNLIFLPSSLHCLNSADAERRRSEEEFSAVSTES